MKKAGVYTLSSLLFILVTTFAFAQKKYDKALAKIDGYYNAGNYSKASSKLQKF